MIYFIEAQRGGEGLVKDAEEPREDSQHAKTEVELVLKGTSEKIAC